MPRNSMRSSRRAGMVLLAAVAAITAGPLLSPHVGLAAAGVAETPKAESGFFTKVAGAAAQGATAALVAAALSACTEPLVNRLLVKRQTFGQAWQESSFSATAKFFLTTFPTNMLKFPIFEVINIVLGSTGLEGSLRGIVNGWLFCTVMLPVTNYRFRKSMGWEVKPALLYQAYIPTVARDMVYGWARATVGKGLGSSLSPETELAKATVFGTVIFLACIISSPCNEWRGFTLQQPDKRLPFMTYFKPVNYARSTGVGATIMGIALASGYLVTPYAEKFMGYLNEHRPVAAVLVLLAVALVVKKFGKK
mmetsp:Transcript_14652/g.33324  ORF Transcript_14652/g.33324 Transcript_14652/m.33324 type:complete len:308 (+) Transcript_14652:86-1009(+)